MASGGKILIISGETSGDHHAAGLVRKLKKKSSSLSFFGIGGNQLADQGVEILEHIDKMAVMGLIEVVQHYRFLKQTFNKVLVEVDSRKPARAILVDYPGFNLRLSKELKKRDIPITYFISPQLWAWKEKRLSIIKECVDQMLCIFPFEENWYQERGVEANFVGHPFLSDCQTFLSKDNFKLKHEISQKNNIIALMPGSRQQEVTQHLPLMINAVEKLKKQFEISAIIGKAPGVKLPSPLPKGIMVEEDDPELALRYSKVGIVSSGTISLQSALFGVPSVVIYKMHLISWWYTKMISQVKYASMTNLIAQKEILPELLQSAVNANAIVIPLKKWLRSEKELHKTKTQLAKVRGELGCPGAFEKAAELIVERLSLE